MLEEEGLAPKLVYMWCHGLSEGEVPVPGLFETFGEFFPSALLACATGYQRLCRGYFLGIWMEISYGLSVVFMWKLYFA